MKWHRHTKKYYLRKIQEGQLKKEEVANVFDTTVPVVEEALIEYNKQKNPFRKKDFEFKNGIVQIVVSIISIILVLLTLFEMQAARNATYMPNISLSKTENAIAWDNNGTIYNIDNETKDILLKMNVENKSINAISKLKIFNIGVGTAKNIALIWDHEKICSNL